MKTRMILTGLTLALCVSGGNRIIAAEAPRIGQQAPDFELKTLDGEAVRLSALTAKQPVVLVVLRGWPGYQCPACDRQVQDFIGATADFAQAGVRVLFVYPGPAQDLQAHAREFAAMKGKQWPTAYLFALDPDYRMVNDYGLRWDAPQETAYPAAFILDANGKVRFANVSRSHGGRAKATEVVKAVKALPES